VAWIPRDACWFVADVVIEITVEGESRNVVHINTLLVSANRPEEAWDKACELGARDAGEPYLNPAGRLVTSRFVGLRSLDVVHDALEHGAELYFEEIIGVDAATLARLRRDKSELSIFRAPSEDRDCPDYSSGEIERDFTHAVEQGEAKR
jgi:hypothetical protein